MTQPLVIMGVSGSGKSTVGKWVAAELQRPFFDADAYHPPENVAKMSGGEPLNDDDRAPWLARLATLLHDQPGAVLACSALKRAYREQLGAKADVRFVFLDVPREVLAERMGDRDGHFMPETLLDSQLNTLEVPQDDEPAVRVDGALALRPLVNQVVAAVSRE